MIRSERSTDMKHLSRGSHQRSPRSNSKGKTMTATAWTTADRVELAKNLLLRGVSEAGSYEADEALTRVEEQLTMAEYSHLSAFLDWCGAGRFTFGRGNLDERLTQFAKQDA